MSSLHHVGEGYVRSALEGAKAPQKAAFLLDLFPSLRMQVYVLAKMRYNSSAIAYMLGIHEESYQIKHWQDSSFIDDVNEKKIADILIDSI